MLAAALTIALAAGAAAVPVLKPPRATPLPGCETYAENQCVADEVETDPKYATHRWHTPPPGHPEYQPGYQSHHQLVGYAHVVYAPDRTSAEVRVMIEQRENATASFVFDGVAQDDNVKVYSAATKRAGPAKIQVTDATGAELVLDDIDFLWDAPAVNQSAAYRNGQKGAVVEFFGWPHADIEQECEFLANAGYMGAKLFPTHEQLMADDPYENELNPWYFMYQPVSYRLEGRGGSRADLRSLIQTCRALGVRVYADAVINHMVGSGNDAWYHRDQNCNEWGPKRGSAADPSFFITQGFAYEPSEFTGLPPQQEFPSVPWSATSFHCERIMGSWTSPLELDAGWLVGLTDLNTDLEYVRERIAVYLTDLISIGFSGFRIDAAKHIRPDSIAAILAKVKRNLGGSFPDDFITWLEMIIGGEADLLFCNEESGYNYGEYFTKSLKAEGFTDAEADMVKIWFSGYPKEPSVDCGSVSMVRKVIQNDDHDQQSEGSSSRDMGDQGSVLVIEKDVAKHREFNVKLFADPNGANDNDNDFPVRFVLSSYLFAENGAKAIPDGLSDCSLCSGEFCDSCQSVEYSPAHDPDSCGYDMDVYTRPHRDADVIAAMRGWLGLAAVSKEGMGLPKHC